MFFLYLISKLKIKLSNVFLLKICFQTIIFAFTVMHVTYFEIIVTFKYNCCSKFRLMLVYIKYCLLLSSNLLSKYCTEKRMKPASSFFKLFEIRKG